MDTKNWSKKDRIACIIIFSICILTFVVFVSAMTLSYFYDTHSASGIITAGEVKIAALGGPSNDGKIQFPSVLAPNTQYFVEDDNNLMYSVVNRSSTGSVFVMLKLESDYFNIVKPILEPNSDGSYWATGEGDSHYLYYMKPLEQGESALLCDAWQVGNISNLIKGSAITYTITAYAVQSQGDAVIALVDSNSDGWGNAPQIFVDMASSF